MKTRALVVDDDPDIVLMLTDRLKSQGYDTVSANNGQRALEIIEHDTPCLVLLDLELPRVSGMEVLKQLAQSRRGGQSVEHLQARMGLEGLDVPVIVMTAHGTIKGAVEAMKILACDFLTKPLDLEYLSILVRKVFEQKALKRQVEYLRTEVQARYSRIIGMSPKIDSVIDLAKRAAVSEATVLLLGESGTGKELFARFVHQWSPRHAMPFIVINCLALTDTLLENELFGHERGAFTGADSLQKGKIEIADGGTVFLDEIRRYDAGVTSKTASSPPRS